MRRMLAIRHCQMLIFALHLFRVVTGFSTFSFQPSKLSLRVRGVLAQQQQQNDDNHESSLRRNVLFSLPIAVFTGARPASAGLIRFPCPNELMNTYHFMRAGESLLEAQNILTTNPMLLTNRDNALSETGVEQANQACQFLEQHMINPSVVKFSLAANAMDTADKISMDMHVGRNRLVPEYTYMDQRALGKWDGLSLQSTQDAVWAMDVAEAGVDGLGALPPANDDGTPNETLMHQVTKLRQLFSLLESSLSGDSILLIFPDGTGPALLSALIAGIPLNRVHELDFKPGEVRLDITYDKVRNFLPAKPSVDYTEAITRGKGELQKLRVDPEQLVSVRDQQYEADMAAKKEADAVSARAMEKAKIDKEKASRAKKEREDATREKERQSQEAERQRKKEEIALARKHEHEQMQLREAENKRTREEAAIARKDDAPQTDLVSACAVAFAAALVSLKGGSSANDPPMTHEIKVDITPTSTDDPESVNTEKEVLADLSDSDEKAITPSNYLELQTMEMVSTALEETLIPKQQVAISSASSKDPQSESNQKMDLADNADKVTPPSNYPELETIEKYSTDLEQTVNPKQQVDTTSISSAKPESENARESKNVKKEALASFVDNAEKIISPSNYPELNAVQKYSADMEQLSTPKQQPLRGTEEDELKEDVTDSEETSPELQAMEDLIANAPVNIPEIESQIETKDPQELVDRAMQEYMDRDDGGEDWLESLVGMMSDDIE